MQYKTTKLTVFLMLFLLSLSSVLALNSTTTTITSQPSSLLSNVDYNLGFSITDTGNNTVNVTALLFVNSVNVVNSTWTKNVTISPNNTFVTVFNNGYYSEGDSVYVNVSVLESSNSAVKNSSLTNVIVIDKSSNSIIAKDTFSGLPSLGSNVGGFLTGISSGVVGLLFGFGMVLVIIIILVAVVKGVHAHITKNEVNK